MQRATWRRLATALLVGSIIVVPAAVPSLAQSSVAEVWRQTVPNHVGVMMDLDAGDNVFALGYGPSGVLTRKYDPNGTLLWERAFPVLPERALPTWISTDAAGNAFVTAHRITGSSSTPAGWWVFKYDAAGNRLWQDFIPASYGRTVRVESDPFGNAYVTGTMFLENEFGNLALDTVTIKYSPGGTRLWTRVFNGDPYTVDQPRSVAVSGDGTRIGVVGQSSGAFYTVVYDAQGNELGRTIRLDLLEADDAAFDPQNKLYVGTNSWTPETSNQMTIAGFNASGGLLFVRSYPDGDFVERLAVDSEGNIVAAGVDQAASAYTNWVVLKVEPDGDRLWSRTYDAHQSNDERPFALSIDPMNGIYVTGEAGPPPPGPNISWLQMTTVKFAPDGAYEWVVFSDIGRGVSVRIGTDLAVFVQGQGQMLTVRYDQTDPGGGPPAAPSGLSVTGTTQTQISLQWVNGTDDQTGVRIERCKGAGCTNFLQITQVSGTSTSYSDFGLMPKTIYRYRVRAFNDNGDSPYSNIVSAKTKK